MISHYSALNTGARISLNSKNNTKPEGIKANKVIIRAQQLKLLLSSFILDWEMNASDIRFLCTISGLIMENDVIMWIVLLVVFKQSNENLQESKWKWRLWGSGNKEMIRAS